MRLTWLHHAVLPTLLSGLLLTGSCTRSLQAAEPKSNLHSQRTQVGLIFTNGIPALRSDLIDGRSRLILIDTGASMVVASDAWARELRGQPCPSSFGHLRDAAGIRRPIDKACSLPLISVGEARFQNIEAIVLNLDNLRLACGGSLDGMYGMSMFRDCLLTIDYPGRKLVLDDAPLPPVNRADVLEMRMTSGGVPSIPVEIAGRRYWAVVDTGFSGTLSVPEEIARELDFAAPLTPGPEFTSLTTARRMQRGRLDGDVRLGHFRLQNPSLEVSRESDVVIGSGLLKHFVVSIDQRQQSLRLTRPLPVGQLVDAGLPADLLALDIP